MNFPADLRYTKDHEWIKADGDEYIIGITDFAQHELGDIVYVDVSAVGNTLSAGEVFGTVEAVKTVSDLFMPVDGKVLGVNESLNAAPESVNNDPYGNGWLIRVKVANTDQVNGLLTSEQYKALVD